jgi:sulfatase maturation enzyme AslB (radical SAM superfamily)
MHERSYGPQRASVELTNICNLHCGYCLRDEDALYHTPARYFPIPLLKEIARQGREAAGLSHISFTGGEPALHPQFAEAIATVESEGLTTSFVTNGWHFERVWPVIAAHRDTVTLVAFSLDGTTLEAHDKWRGQGSFVRLIQAFSRCRHYDFPFEIKVVVRKDTSPHLEEIAIFAARMGAAALNFGHLLPTSDDFDHELSLTEHERTMAEQEIAVLARMFKMPIRLDVGYFNIDASRPPCSPLAGVSCHIDYRGYLTLCCNLSGFRGAVGQADVVADLNTEDFTLAYPRLRSVADQQMERWRATLAEYEARDERPDLTVGSPCLFCLHTLGKTPWRDVDTSTLERRALPVIKSVPA